MTFQILPFLTSLHPRGSLNVPMWFGHDENAEHGILCWPLLQKREGLGDAKTNGCFKAGLNQ